MRDCGYRLRGWRNRTKRGWRAALIARLGFLVRRLPRGMREWFYRAARRDTYVKVNGEWFPVED